MESLNIISKIVLGLWTLFVMALSQAGTPVWTFTPRTPTSLTIASTNNATVEYLVTNQSRKTHTLLMKAIPGVTQLTTAGHCPSPFVLGYNQSCILNLAINGHALIENVEKGPIVCQQGNANQCYQPSSANTLKITKDKGKFSFVGDASSNLWQCPMNATGGFRDGECTLLTNGTAPGFVDTLDLAFATFSGTTYGYVTDFSSNLWQCAMNATGGFRDGECTPLTNGTAPGFHFTQSVTFATFSGTTYAYVGDASSNLWQCPMNATGGFNGGACTSLTNGTAPGFLRTWGITFATFLETTYGYIADDSSNLWQCPMNNTGGIIGGACTQLTNGTAPGFGSTLDLAFATFSGTTYGYVTNFSSNLWQCPMNDTGGIIGGACTQLINGTAPGFSNTWGVAFSTFLGVTNAYVADRSGSLWKCPMNGIGGISDDGCTPLVTSTAPGFLVTSNVTFDDF